MLHHLLCNPFKIKAFKIKKQIFSDFLVLKDDLSKQAYLILQEELNGGYLPLQNDCFSDYAVQGGSECLVIESARLYEMHHTAGFTNGGGGHFLKKQ